MGRILRAAASLVTGLALAALYAGNGNVIHSPHPGKKVSYIKIKYMPYVGARRPA